MKTIGSTRRAALVGLIAVVALTGLGLVRPGVAAADDHRGPRPEARFERRADFHRFRGGDVERWRGGRWVHVRHGGRLGWWWVVNGAWYFYPAPVYPYPEPYVVPAPPAPPVAQGYWYYCPSAQAYYPYVAACPGGWTTVVPPAP